MALQQSKFKLDETILLAGNQMQVTGILQLEQPTGQIATRYLLAGGAGAPQILEEQGDCFSLLRPFPAATQPQVADDAINVMGEKYKRAGIAKLTVSGSAGQTFGNVPEGSVLLSGQFTGALGTVVREVAPGATSQNFYALKPVPSSEILTAEQLAARQAAEMQMREEQAQAQAEAGAPEGGGGSKIVRYIVVLLVIAGLVYACTGPDESDSSGSSARTVGSGFHGK